MWGKSDQANNSPVFAINPLKVTANSANRTALFGNTTADAFVSKATVGVFGVGQDEAKAGREGLKSKVAHAGWQLRTVGTGGRAGRVQMETLVAFGSNMDSDAADDAVIPDFGIKIVTNPANASGSNTANDVVVFSTNAVSVPTGGTIGYFWQRWTGSAFANLTNTGAFSNTTTAALSVLANTAPSGSIFRAGYTVSGGAPNKFSSNATLTVTT